MKKSSEVVLVAAAVAASFLIPTLRALVPSEPSSEMPAPTAVAAEPSHTGFRTRIAPQLNLDEAQKTGLQAIRQQERAQMLSLQADTSLTAEQKRARAREIHLASRDEARAILTPEQQALIDQLRAARPASSRRPAFRKTSAS